MPTITDTAGARITAPPGATVADLVLATGHAGPVRLNGWELVTEPLDCEVPLELLDEVALLAEAPTAEPPTPNNGWAVPIGGGWLTVCSRCAPACIDDGATVHASDIDGAVACVVTRCDVCDGTP